MGYRYRVLDLPVMGAGAFCPIPTTNPASSSWGLVHTYRYDAPVPVGARGVAPTYTNAPQVQGTNNVPDVIVPAAYIASARNMGPTADAGIGMAERRWAPLPVPARAINRVPLNAMRARRIGGRSALAWPRTFQRFPTLKGKANAG